eukprot:6113797-Prymnesium_polylepis.1
MRRTTIRMSWARCGATTAGRAWSRRSGLPTRERRGWTWVMPCGCADRRRSGVHCACACARDGVGIPHLREGLDVQLGAASTAQTRCLMIVAERGCSVRSVLVRPPWRGLPSVRCRPNLGHHR